MKVWFHPYQLKSKNALGTLSEERHRQGALLKIFFPEIGTHGFADLHPWVELGHQRLAVQLAWLSKGESSPLLKQALYFAQLDAKARSQKENLFDYLEVPPSHFLVTDPETLTPFNVEAARSQGFNRIKIKIGRHPDIEALRINRIAPSLGANTKLRLDFNNCMNAERLKEFLKRIQKNFYAIDFLEDPFPYNADEWRKIKNQFQLRLAVDQNCQEIANSEWLPDIFVIKPASENMEDFLEPIRTYKRKIVFTSSLDHPLGQVAAAWIAAKLRVVAKDLVIQCGLVSHLVYEPNEFSEVLQVKDAKLIPPPGTGFGFDELLENLPWQDLK